MTGPDDALVAIAVLLLAFSVAAMVAGFVIALRETIEIDAKVGAALEAAKAKLTAGPPAAGSGAMSSWWSGLVEFVRALPVVADEAVRPSRARAAFAVAGLSVLLAATLLVTDRIVAGFEAVNASTTTTTPTTATTAATTTTAPTTTTRR